MKFGFNFGFLDGSGLGSVVLAYILYSNQFKYTLDANGNTLMTNKGTALDAAVASGHGVELQVDNELLIPVSPNTYITLVNGDGTVTQIDNTADTSTTYPLTNQTVLEATPTTSPFTTADLALIEADTSLMTRLALGATDTGLSLIIADVFEHYAFSEYSGADCYGTKNGTIAIITNNLPTIRENVNFNPKANQDIEFERDINGTPTAFNNTQMNMHSDTSADIQWNPSTYSEFIIEESVELVFYSHIYDGVNLITWTNGIEGVGVGHTPENNNYLLGKGVYPKVTEDPYTTYVQDYFEVILDATKIANYDALQAYSDYIGVRYSITKQIDDTCTYVNGSAGCTTDALFVADKLITSTPTNYIWSVVGATIVNGQGTDAVVVSTPIGLTDIPYTITLIITDEYGNITITENYVAVKKPEPIVIIAITEDIVGSCELT